VAKLTTNASRVIERGYYYSMPATRVDDIVAENFVENDLDNALLIGNSKFYNCADSSRSKSIFL